MFNIGSQELLITLFVVLMLFGAKRIPEVARSFGKGMRDFKRAMQGFEDELKLEVEEPETRARRKPRQLGGGATGDAVESSERVADDAPRIAPPEGGPIVARPIRRGSDPDAAPSPAEASQQDRASEEAETPDATRSDEGDASSSGPAEAPGDRASGGPGGRARSA